MTTEVVLISYSFLLFPQKMYFISVYEKLRTEKNRQFAVKSAERITSPSQLIWGADDKVGYFCL